MKTGGLRRGFNPAQTKVGYEEIRKRALQEHKPDALIGLDFPAEFAEFLRHLGRSDALVRPPTGAALRTGLVGESEVSFLS